MNALSARYEGETVDTSLAIRSKLRMAFLEQEKAETMNYANDLETTLAINKQLIKELCDTTLMGNDKCKTAIKRLNEENAALQRQVKGLVKQRNDAEGKLLINAQIIEMHKLKQAEDLRDWKERLAELEHELNKKEYNLQEAETKFQELEFIVMKYMKQIPEVRTLLAERYENSGQSIGITNVVAENQQLKATIAQLSQENRRLREDLALRDGKLEHQKEQRIERLREENEMRRTKIEELQRQNRELYELNEKLSAQLDTVGRQVNLVLHSQRILQTEALHSQRGPKDPTCHTMATPEQHRNMSFGHMSSISDSVLAEQLANVVDDPTEYPPNPTSAQESQPPQKPTYIEGLSIRMLVLTCLFTLIELGSTNIISACHFPFPDNNANYDGPSGSIPD